MTQLRNEGPNIPPTPEEWELSPHELGRYSGIHCRKLDRVWRRIPPAKILWVQENIRLLGIKRLPIVTDIPVYGAITDFQHIKKYGSTLYQLAVLRNSIPKYGGKALKSFGHDLKS